MSLEAFGEFCDENADKVRMPRAQNYPLNYELAQKWADRQCDDESKEFADSIVKGTIYVSFERFMHKLEQICSDYTAAVDPAAAYVLIVPFSLEKSNVWVSMLAYPHLKQALTHIYYDITTAFNDSRKPGSPLYGRAVHCVVCDDCAYTGTQLMEHISTFDLNRIHFERRRAAPSPHDPEWLIWHASMKEEVGRIVQQIDITQFSVDLIIPYMSILADKRLERIHYVKKARAARVFPIFAQVFDVEQRPPHIANEFRRTFQYHKDISAIYFDHKIADGLSTFNKVYLFAPLFNCNPPNMNIPFIEGCMRRIPEGINPHDFIPDVERLVPVCPPTFYKTIDYTWRGEKIDRKLTVFGVLRTAASPPSRPP
jgi:hypothetical protein